MGFPYSPKLLSTSTRFLPCKRWRERLVDLRGSQCFVFLALVIPIAFLVSLSTPSEDQAQVLDKQAKLAEQTSGIIGISTGSLNRFLSLSVQTRTSLRPITIDGNY